LPDQVLRLGDARSRDAGVVLIRDVERLAVDLAGALRRVLEPVLEPLELLGAVGPENPGARIDESDVVRGRRMVRARGDGCGPSEQREERSPEQDLREAMTHERILLV